MYLHNLQLIQDFTDTDLPFWGSSNEYIYYVLMDRKNEEKKYQYCLVKKKEKKPYLVKGKWYIAMSLH